MHAEEWVGEDRAGALWTATATPALRYRDTLLSGRALTLDLGDRHSGVSLSRILDG